VALRLSDFVAYLAGKVDHSGGYNLGMESLASDRHSRLRGRLLAMAITFHPRIGMILMCDFSAGGFKPPEMVKVRPVVVLSKTDGQVVTVVPLSATEPIPVQPHHHEMTTGTLPASLAMKRCWAKCDLVTTVGLWRLDRIFDGRCPTTGKRQYISPSVSDVELEAIRQALRYVLRL
jgi:mRNA interferase MazF